MQNYSYNYFVLAVPAYSFGKRYNLPTEYADMITCYFDPF